jgi:hypothetical protein
MRTLLCAAILLLTLSRVSPAQQSFGPDHQLPVRSVSGTFSDGSAAKAAVAALFDPVPVNAISGDSLTTCAAPATSATLPPAPVAKGSEPVAVSVPNSDALPAAHSHLLIASESRTDSRKRFLFSNTAMYGATVFHAFGRQAEVDACKREAGFANGVYLRGSYKGMTPPTMTHFYAITLPIDAGVTLVSALARAKGWRAFEIAAPLSAASAHITAGAFKFSSGCY